MIKSIIVAVALLGFQVAAAQDHPLSGRLYKAVSESVTEEMGRLADLKRSLPRLPADEREVLRVIILKSEGCFHDVMVTLDRDPERAYDDFDRCQAGFHFAIMR